MEDSGSDGPVGSETFEIKNGKAVDATGRWRGVVSLKIFDPGRNAWTPCTAFVGSRSALITAAHCVMGALNGGTSGAVQVLVRRENADGTWDTIVPQGYAMAVRHPSYNGVSAQHDVAVINTPLQNTVSDDAVAIAKTSPSGRTMFGIGYGYHDVNSYDGHVRSGDFVPNYDSFAHQYTFSALKATDPWICSGDSGGPLKRVDNVWLVYGIASGYSGNGGHCGPSGRWAATADNWPWLKSTLVRCTDLVGRLSCW
jgi:hypothetical protein